MPHVSRFSRRGHSNSECPSGPRLIEGDLPTGRWPTQLRCPTHSRTLRMNGRSLRLFSIERFHRTMFDFQRRFLKVHSHRSALYSSQIQCPYVTDIHPSNGHNSDRPVDEAEVFPSLRRRPSMLSQPPSGHRFFENEATSRLEPAAEILSGAKDLASRNRASALPKPLRKTNKPT